MRRRDFAAAVLMGLVGLTLAGCSGGAGKISGTVNLDGQPLADARVEFHPKQALQQSLADVRTDAQGHFEVQPRPKSRESLPPGQYVVLIRKLVDDKGNVPGDEDYGQLEAAGKLRNKVPQRYNDRDFPQITVEVKPDTKEFPPFELKSK